MMISAEVERVSSLGLAPRRIVLSRVRIPLHEPFRISNGVIFDKESIIVHVETSQGEGFGEASPMSGSFYSSDTPDSAWMALAEVLVPRALALPKLQLGGLFEVFQELPREHFAKAGLEGALWDACANILGRPLFELLGACRHPIPSGVAIGIYPEIEDLLSRAARYLHEGYQRVKIKIQPGWDVEPVQAIRRHFGDVPLMVDANAAYTLDQTSVFEELDGYNLMMIEQPLACHALYDHAELQRRLKTPICLDESAESLEALDEIFRFGSARIINVKVQRVGGLAIARMIHDRCLQAGIPCWLGTMPELGIASAQGLHLGTLQNFTYPTDVEASARWFIDDIVDPLLTVDRKGWIHLPEGAGMGYRVNRDKVDHYCVERKVFEP